MENGSTLTASSAGFRVRRLAALLGGIAIAAVLVPLSGPAYAESGDLTCAAAGQMNFSPALTATNTSAKVSQSAAAFNCTSPNGRYPDLKSASAPLTGSATSAPGVNPCNTLVTIQEKGVVTWSPTGQRSTVDLLMNLNPSAGSVTVTFTVTGGVLAGDSVTFVGTLAPNADCAVNGLASLAFEGVDTIA